MATKNARTKISEIILVLRISLLYNVKNIFQDLCYDCWGQHMDQDYLKKFFFVKIQVIKSKKEMIMHITLQGAPA